MGAALTYARRYALFTLVGIAGADDLDAPDLRRRRTRRQALRDRSGRQWKAHGAARQSASHTRLLAQDLADDIEPTRQRRRSERSVPSALAHSRGGLAIQDTAPEFPLRGDDEVRIGMGLDLDPFALPVMAEHSSCRPTPAVFRAIHSIKISPNGRRVGKRPRSLRVSCFRTVNSRWAGLNPLLDGRYSQRARQFKSLSVCDKDWALSIRMRCAMKI